MGIAPTQASNSVCCAEEQHTGYTAADRRLGQRHVDGGEPDPDKRHQQPVDNKGDDGRERIAGEDRPGGDPHQQQGKSGCRKQGRRHVGGGP